MMKSVNRINDSEFEYYFLDRQRKQEISRGNLRIPQYITKNMPKKFELRNYQIEAIQNTILKIENNPYIQEHFLYHMATGTGKTNVMAAMMLFYYKRGYRNFLFFVNQGNIIDKTKINFLDETNKKYCFTNNVEIDGKTVFIREVNSFNESEDNCINIIFTTIQGLHSALNTPKENGLSYSQFKKNKMVMIGDEAHHLNAKTKLNLQQKKDNESWEETIDKLFLCNRNNVILEFTATCELNNEKIFNKYKNLIVYNYPLLKFREDGWTKDFLNMQSNLDINHRVLQALLLSQYRLKLFENHDIFVNPVVMLKSKDTIQNKYNYNKFFEFLCNLEPSNIDKIRNVEVVSDSILSTMFKYFKKNNITDEILVLELQQAFSKDKSIIIDSKSDKLDEKRSIINKLDDKNNKYRLIFTVDMLNEGWDVVSLFDIVRMFDSMSVTSKNIKKASPATISEAQLIGRGVRYFPFIIEKGENQHKRKFDEDDTNELRICETLYYHSRDDSKYIYELRLALKEIGFDSDDKLVFEFALKPKFKTTKIYQDGCLLKNKRYKKGRSEVYKLENGLIDMQTEYKNISSHKELGLANDEIIVEKISKCIMSKPIKVAEFSKTHYYIVESAFRQCGDVFTFDRLKGYYPHLKSIREFITSENYAGKFELILYTEKEPNNIDYYNGLLLLFSRLSNAISNLKERYGGTKEFVAVPLKKYIREVVKRQKFKTGDEGEGEGYSQNSPFIQPEYKMDLSKEEYDWYVYNDNYGTDQEKKFVKKFSFYVNALKEKYDEVYLIRNERNFTVYSFDDGKGFQPDFILLLINRNAINLEEIQVFAEPKGTFLLPDSSWKEEFLQRLNTDEEVKAFAYNNDRDKFKVIGLPLFNSPETEKEVCAAITKLYE